MTKKNYSCIAIGNFDGIHKGHNELIKNMISISEKYNFNSKILTFKYVDDTMKKSSKNLKYIVNFANKIKMLESYSVDEVCILELDEIVSKYSPQTFIENILLDRYNMKHIVVGYNFRFGYKAEGTVDTLLDYSKKYCFDLSIIHPIKIDNKEVSSTLIRNYIYDGNISEVNKLLTNNYTIFNSEVNFISRKSCIVFKNSVIIIPKDGQYYVRVGNIKCILNITQNEQKDKIFLFNKEINTDENIIFLNK